MKLGRCGPGIDRLRATLVHGLVPDAQPCQVRVFANGHVARLARVAGTGVPKRGVRA